MLPPHKALDRRVQGRNGASSLVDQNVACILQARSLLRGALIDSGLRACLSGAGWSRLNGIGHAAQKSAGSGAQNIRVSYFRTVTLEGDVEVILEGERDRILQGEV